MRQLDGLVAVITGGGRGIGRALALRFGAEGATVVVSSRTASDLEATLEEAELDEARGLAVVADAMDREEAKRPVLEALDRFGHLDILINNVGGHAGGDPDPFTGDEMAFERTLTLSLTSAWWTSAAAMPLMRERRFGRIINIGSGASLHTGGSVGYTAAKHGLVGLTKELAKAGARHGINANVLCPGWTKTSMIDFAVMARSRGTTEAEEYERAQSTNLQRRVLEANELGGMAVLLAGPEGRGITGQVIAVDGGYRV